uniref:Uncharacterized protein n=1 Tax=Anopheles merus TaxID=30066 RepID=A0A182VI91_ANOME
MGLVQEVHLFANSSPKHSAQYGFSSRLVKRWPASDTWQCVHVKHSRCHARQLYAYGGAAHVHLCRGGAIARRSGKATTTVPFTVESKIQWRSNLNSRKCQLRTV